MRRLFLDDMREPKEVSSYKPAFGLIYEKEWDIVRNYDEFKRYIEEKGVPDLISFDHDLAEEHYASMGSYEGFKEKTGYHCMQWLISYLMDNKDAPTPNVFLHTMNPVGMENMRSLWENFLKVSEL